MEGKKIIIGTLGIGLLWLFFRNKTVDATHEGRVAPESGLADVDGDGWVTETDVQTIKDAYLELITLTDEQFSRADVKQDGKVGIDDYLMAKRYLTGDLDLD